jgi:hypothetical protein
MTAREPLGSAMRTTLVSVVIATSSSAAHATERAPETFRVLLDETRTWAPGGAEAPDLSRSSPRATLAFFDARTSAEGARAVAACTTIEVSGWLEEIRPIAEDRLEGLAAGAFVKAMGRPPKWTRRSASLAETRNGVSRLELVPSGASADRGASGALTLGFSGGPSPKVVACFAVCAPRDEEGPSCHAEHARFEGPYVPPPPPSLPLRALAYAVHHPRETTAAAGALALALAALYVRGRPRPRVRVPGPAKESPR